MVKTRWQLFKPFSPGVSKVDHDIVVVLLEGLHEGGRDVGHAAAATLSTCLFTPRDGQRERETGWYSVGWGLHNCLGPTALEKGNQWVHHQYCLYGPVLYSHFILYIKIPPPAFQVEISFNHSLINIKVVSHFFPIVWFQFIILIRV